VKILINLVQDPPRYIPSMELSKVLISQDPNNPTIQTHVSILNDFWIYLKVIFLITKGKIKIKKE
jgi:hypothetical protein